jgi:hypothetical protein
MFITLIFFFIPLHLLEDDEYYDITIEVDDDRT